MGGDSLPEAAHGQAVVSQSSDSKWINLGQVHVQDQELGILKVLASERSKFKNKRLRFWGMVQV